ncbi:uncharacterized protein LOC131885196 [Tigriopus californicus]|uniref:uncharacterized protein LOC131885196 n=1 Tax=Tigriopus californicus TaxID=6832 RepID=UPI0027DA843E|nr:uncharacterized protein LOC131885196 [Tigriopus californicus]
MRQIGLLHFWALYFIHVVRSEQFDIPNADGNHMQVIFSEELQKFVLKPAKGHVITKYDFLEGKIGYLNFWENYCIILPLDAQTLSFQDHLSRLKSGILPKDRLSDTIYVEESFPKFDDALCDRLPRYDVVNKVLNRSKRSVEDPNIWYYRRHARRFSGQTQSQLMRHRNCPNGRNCDENDEATARASSDGVESTVLAGGNSMGQAQSQMFPWISPYNNNFGSGSTLNSQSRGDPIDAHGMAAGQPPNHAGNYGDQIPTVGQSHHQNLNSGPSPPGNTHHVPYQERSTPFTDKHRYGAPGTVGGIRQGNRDPSGSRGFSGDPNSGHVAKYVPSNGFANQPFVANDGLSRRTGSFQPGTNVYQDKQSEERSQASSQVRHGGQGSMASASSGGGYGAGATQSQVQGSYSGTGSFSGQSQSSGGWGQSSASNIQAGPAGSSSQAGTSINARSGSQTQVQVGPSGNSAINSQSLYRHGGSSTNLQANQRGGQVGAQATGEGATNSQAQIRFQPGANAQNGFLGGGQASAQSQGYMGQAQSQLFGNLDNGKMYSGAAQAGSGTRRGQHGSSTRNEVRNNGDQPPNTGSTDQVGMHHNQNRRKQFGYRGVSEHRPQPMDEHIQSSQSDYHYAPGTRHRSNGQHSLPQNNGYTTGHSGTAQTNDQLTPIYQRRNTNQETPPLQPVSAATYAPQPPGTGGYPSDPMSSYPQEASTRQSPNPVGQPSPRPNYQQSQNAYVNHMRVQGNPEVRYSNDASNTANGKLYEAGQQVPGFPGYKVPNGYRARVISSESESASATVQGPGQAQTQTLNINFPSQNRYPSQTPGHFDRSNDETHHARQSPKETYTRRPNPSLSNPYQGQEANKVPVAIPGQIPNGGAQTDNELTNYYDYYDSYGNEPEYYYDDIQGKPPKKDPNQIISSSRPVVTPPPTFSTGSNIKGYQTPRPPFGEGQERGDISSSSSSSRPDSQIGSTGRPVSSSEGTNVASRRQPTDESRCQGFGNNPCYNKPYSGSFQITGQGTYQYVPSSSGNYRSHSSTYGGHFKVRPSGEDEKDDSTWKETNYSQASTCGYFTFSCNIALGSDRRTKICFKDPNQCNS